MTNHQFQPNTIDRTTMSKVVKRLDSQLHVAGEPVAFGSAQQLIAQCVVLRVALVAIAFFSTFFVTSGATANQSRTETRVALVIGNSDYKSSPLNNPANDASDLAVALEKKGFKVLVRENTSERGLKEAVDSFAKLLRKGGVGLFFFAGHGVQVKGENFLVPTDIGFDSEADIAYKGVSAEYVLSKMAEAGNRLNIVILDACRNNPFQQSRSTGKGLGAMNVGGGEKGTYIAYATSPGSTASDGAGRNGLYTRSLLESLAVPDPAASSLFDVFGRVVTNVVQETSGEQVPWIAGSPIGRFYFDPKEDQIQAEKDKTDKAARLLANSTVATAPEQTSTPYDPLQEQLLWERVKDSRVPADFIAYLEKFSGSKNAAYARWLAKKFGGVVPPTLQPPAPTQLQITPGPQVVSAPANVSAAAYDPPAKPVGLPPIPAIIKDCGNCPELVVVQGGEFVMGSGKEEKLRESDEEPAHRVRVGGPLAVGKFEVTRGQYSEFVKDTRREQIGGCNSTIGGRFSRNAKATWSNPGFPQQDDEPVVCVSWDDASAYTVWLTKRTGKPYRLLSETEWEYVARAGTSGRRHWVGNDDAVVCRLASVADTTLKRHSPGLPIFACDDGFPYTAPVGRFPPNSFGVYDMLGNVAEWVEDCWIGRYAEALALSASRPAGPCTERGFRGGAWNGKPATVRTAYRDRESNDERHDSIGFRVVRPWP